VSAAAAELPRPRESLWRIPRTRSLLGLGVVGAIVGVLLTAARLYTELLWYDEVGQPGTFWTTLQWKLVTGAAVALAPACFVLLNLRAVDRALPLAPRRELRRLAAPAVAVACGAIAFALRSDDTWRLLLLWAHRTDFGVADPLFHRDVGYYVFSLPLYREVSRWLLETVLLATVATVAAYASAGVHPRAARSHLLALAALLLAVLAWRFRLQQLELALPRHEFPGASHSDVHVRLPALRILSAMTLAGAAAPARAAGAGSARRAPRAAARPADRKSVV